jgi:hypothetical protein
LTLTHRQLRASAATGIESIVSIRAGFRALLTAAGAGCGEPVDVLPSNRRAVRPQTGFSEFAV